MTGGTSLVLFPELCNSLSLASEYIKPVIYLNLEKNLKLLKEIILKHGKI